MTSNRNTNRAVASAVNRGSEPGAGPVVRGAVRADPNSHGKRGPLKRKEHAGGAASGNQFGTTDAAPRRERPILFSTALIPKVLDDSKTQTRRIISPVQPRADGRWPGGRDPIEDSHYGHPGDHLWVQEAHRLVDRDCSGGSVIVEYAADKTRRHVYLTDAENEKLDARTSPLTRPMPGRFMCRSLSRTSLDVLSVRVERVQEISEADAEAEGVACRFEGSWRGAFCLLWDSINGERANWASNPWVWAITFKRIEQAKAVANAG